MMRIDIETLATVLAVMHIGSALFIGNVIRKQWRLTRLPIRDVERVFDENDIRQIKRFRLILLFLSSVVLLGNVIPVVIDGITVLGDNALHRNPHVPLISVLYGISNALTALISAYLVWRLYRFSDNPKVAKATTEDLAKSGTLSSKEK